MEPPAATTPDRLSEDLLHLAKRGDLDAFGRFYDQTAPGLLRWLTRRTAAADVAADLCAESFASALTMLDRYDARRGGAPAAWLYGIARNHLRNWLRHERVDRDARERLGIHLAAPNADDIDLVELRVDLEAQVGPLAEALDQLTDGNRDAVTLRVVDELGYAVIAARLGCSEGAARVRVSRGLAQLLDALDGGGDDG